jgi:hypothetical protein
MRAQLVDQLRSSPCTPRPESEQFAIEAGERAQALTLPPPAGSPDFAALAQAAARHQITVLASPQP